MTEPSVDVPANELAQYLNAISDSCHEHISQTDLDIEQLHRGIEPSFQATLRLQREVERFRGEVVRTWLALNRFLQDVESLKLDIRGSRRDKDAAAATS
jgi:hypothetical protein